ncbi:MAG: protein kinase, partial [Myxococcales bacterium]|nr:protein kinase [Myxococcales bacterium]
MALGTRGAAAARARLGRYELRAELQRSPLGVLWLARADGARPVVALRRVVDRAPFGPADRAAVAEVARWARELDHPTLVPIIEIETDGDELGIVQEHVEGESLRNLLRSAALEHAPLPVPVVLRIALDVLDGLEHLRAHRLTIPRGSVFGGLTPETVLVGADGRTRLVEPGVSGLCGGLAPEGSAGATPGLEALGRDPKRAVYHAPERFLGHELEVRADVFVVGALLWEMLRNRALFQGATYDVVAQRVLAGDVQRVDALAPPGGKVAPTRVADAVARALARTVDERPTPGELAEALRATGEATATAADVKACVEALCADALDKQRALAVSASGPAPVSTQQPAERPRAVPPRAGALPRPGGPL